MIATSSSHVFSSISRGGTQWVYGGSMVFLQEQIKDIIIIIISEESESFRFSEPASESLAIPGPSQGFTEAATSLKLQKFE
jgi:hypothetical protein